MRKTLQLLCVAMLVLFTTNVWAAALSQCRHVFVEMANDAKWDGEDDYEYTEEKDGTYDDYYYIKADGGGLNQLHITTVASSEYGQDNGMETEDGTLSDTFWISTTGGRGYNDEIILMITVKPDGLGDLPEDLSINVKSSGYAFPLSTPASATYSTDVIDVTYDEDDFTTYGYGLHAYKPGPNGIPDNFTTWNLPHFTDQTDFTNGQRILFVDLNLGNIYDSQLTDEGSVMVEVSISGLTTEASFNAYAWCKTSNQGQGINWTQNTKDASGTSSYVVTYTGE